MIIKIEVWLSIGLANANRYDELEVEVDDDATPEEIEKAKQEAANEWSWNHIDLGWKDAK